MYGYISSIRNERGVGCSVVVPPEKICSTVQDADSPDVPHKSHVQEGTGVHEPVCVNHDHEDHQLILTEKTPGGINSAHIFCHEKEV